MTEIVVLIMELSYEHIRLGVLRNMHAPPLLKPEVLRQENEGDESQLKSLSPYPQL